MQIGVFAPLTSPFATPQYVKKLGRVAEQLGFHSIWVGEHVVSVESYESSYPYSKDGKLPQMNGAGVLDTVSALGFLAAVTETIRIGSGICILPQRNPVYLAKAFATLDWLSEGRMNCGVGIGWLREEFAVLNAPWPDRGLRADEYLEVMIELWQNEVSVYDGQLYQLPECQMYPKPSQKPYCPIYVGGESTAALNRAAKYGHGWIGFDHDPDSTAEKIFELTNILNRQGRQIDDFSVAVCSWTHTITAATIRAYAACGLNELIVPMLALESGEIKTVLEDFRHTYDVVYPGSVQ